MSMFSNGFKFALVASATAALMACGGGSSTPDAYKVATADLTVPVGTDNGPGTTASISGSTFSFPAGVAALGTTAATTIKLTAASPNSTFEAKTGADTATGDFTYGSCIFTVKTTTNAALWPVGTIAVVNPCTYIIGTLGASANGVAAPRQLTLNLNGSRGTVTVPVTVNPSGAVLVNGGTFGSAGLVVSTGAGG